MHPTIARKHETEYQTNKIFRISHKFEKSSREMGNTKEPL